MMHTPGWVLRIEINRDTIFGLARRDGDRSRGHGGSYVKGRSASPSVMVYTMGLGIPIIV